MYMYASVFCLLQFVRILIILSKSTTRNSYCKVRDRKYGGIRWKLSEHSDYHSDI